METPLGKFKDLIIIINTVKHEIVAPGAKNLRWALFPALQYILVLEKFYNQYYNL